MWWTDEKIRYYERAAKHSTFHSNLAGELEAFLEKDKPIAELGCGLGFMANELTKRGYSIQGYDSDSAAIDYAKSHFPTIPFTLADSYTLPALAPTSLCVFFGHIRTNLDALLETCTERLVYVVNEHEDYSRCAYQKTEAVAAFLEGRRMKFSFTKTHIPFNQPLKNEAELAGYVEENYTKKGRKFEKKIARGGGEYPITVLNDKSISIFSIDKEKRT